jgi:arylsulfatase A-like enzyme
MVKSIIMITLDCARPDHLGCYGYHGVDTPGINKIAREGLIFQQAIAQAPNTWVSHASIFTGCNPYRHGISIHQALFKSKNHC